MLEIKNLTVTLLQDVRTIIEHLSFSVHSGDKIGLIGEEGNGKSTVLKAIAVPEELENTMHIEGEIHRGQAVIGYLPQALDETTLQMRVQEYLDWKLPPEQRDYNAFYQQQRSFQLPDTLFDDDRTLGSLSGGEKIKFLLFVEMLKDPTVLLLDEPTNDLDLESVQWIESFLKNLQIPLLFVSHDAQLLERVANRVIHFEQTHRKSAPKHTVSGQSYADYVDTRQMHILHQTKRAAKEHQEFDKKVQRYQKVYDAVRVAQGKETDPSASKNLKDKMHTVKAMGKRFEKEKENLLQKPDVEDAIFVAFDPDVHVPQGKCVLEFQKETLGLGNRILAKNVSLTVTGPEKICIIGANGAGKTTLMKAILEAAKEKGVSYGYMPQQYDEGIDGEKTPIEFLAPSRKKEDETKASTYLGSLKFTRDEMYHPMAELSGGQRAKVYFAKMTLDKPELLLLDEPTRNISPLSAPEVREAIRHFRGAVIAISHDRAFIEEVPDRILLLNQEGLYVQ